MHTNDDNKIFYEMSPDNFIYTMAQSAGLLSNPDLQIILKHIDSERASTIVDLGAGEGRVIEALLKCSFFNKIVGVEYAESKCRLLKAMFAQSDRVSIEHQDIMNMSGIYDYGLLLFSLLIDFTETEQKLLLHKLDTVIRKKLFIDLPKFHAEKNGIYLPNQNAVIEMSWGRLEGFFPKEGDLISFLGTTSFKLEAVESYQTDTNRMRDLYIFSK